MTYEDMERLLAETQAEVQAWKNACKKYDTAGKEMQTEIEKLRGIIRDLHRAVGEHDVSCDEDLAGFIGKRIKGLEEDNLQMQLRCLAVRDAVIRFNQTRLQNDEDELERCIQGVNNAKLLHGLPEQFQRLTQERDDLQARVAELEQQKNALEKLADNCETCLTGTQADCAECAQNLPYVRDMRGAVSLLQQQNAELKLRIEQNLELHAVSVVDARERAANDMLAHLPKFPIGSHPDQPVPERVDPLLEEADTWGKVRYYEDSGDPSVGIPRVAALVFEPAEHAHLLHAATFVDLVGRSIELLVLEAAVRQQYGETYSGGHGKCRCPMCRALGFIDGNRRKRLVYQPEPELTAAGLAQRFANGVATEADVELLREKIEGWMANPTEVLLALKEVLYIVTQPEDAHEAVRAAMQGRVGIEVNPVFAQVPNYVRKACEAAAQIIARGVADEVVGKLAFADWHEFDEAGRCVHCGVDMDVLQGTCNLREACPARGGEK